MPSPSNSALIPRVALVFLLALVLLLPGIGAGYWGRDEAEYAGVAHGMNETGQFLVPRLFGRLYADKPPLSEWLTAASFRLFGEGEVSGRLPHVLFSAASVPLLLLLGARLFDLRRGALAALVFATSLLLVVYGRLLLTDSDLLFFTLLSLVGLLPILEGAPRWWPVPAAGCALGLALLAKGPVALLGPGFFCAGYLAGARDRPVGSIGRLLLALALSLALAGPWFLLAAGATGGRSLRSFLLRENLERFLRPREGHRGSLLYFPLVAWFGFFPWSGLLPFLFRREIVRRHPVRWGLLFWAGGTLLFFSLAATKLPHYLLPATPAFALLLADADRSAGQKRGRLAAWITAGTGALLFAAAVIAACVTSEPEALWLLVPFGAAGLFSLCVPLFFSQEGARRLGIGAAVLASLAIAVGAAPVLDSLRSTKRLGLAARAARHAGEPLGGLEIQEASLTYYSGAAATAVWESAEAVSRAAEASATRSILLWLDSATTVALVRDRHVSARILAEGPSLADPRVHGRLQLCRIFAPRCRSVGRGLAFRNLRIGEGPTVVRRHLPRRHAVARSRRRSRPPF